MASILINKGPSSEFLIVSGLKQGDPLAPFLFILVMESLHLFVTRAVNDGIFKGLRITGCEVMQTPFKYLGVMVGDHMSRYSACAIYTSRLKCHSCNTLSPWGVILREVHLLASKGDDLNTRFWFDTWILDLHLNVRFPQLFALELDKDISVAAKYFCDLNGDGAYRIKDIRFKLDDLFLPSSAVATRWVDLVPIKVNIFAWRISLDLLPTRATWFSLANWVRVFLKEFVVGGTSIQSEEVSSFVDWFTWFGSIRLPSKVKAVLEGVFYSAWRHVCSFRNRSSN
nr:hypothetical protein [Tanacetum cinerariifolium]